MPRNWDWRARKTDERLRAVLASFPQIGLALLLLLASAWLLQPTLRSHTMNAFSVPTGTAACTRDVVTRQPTPTSFLPTATPEPLTHVVLEGEVLGLIAEEYGTTVEDILEANGVDDADLMSIGQELVIVGARRTPIVVVTPSPTPTPTSVYAYQAPHPLGPTDQAVFVGKDVRIVLRWASVRTLDAPEWYEVRIWLQDRPNVDRVWTKTPSVVVPHSLYPGPWGRVFCWDVAVVQRDGQRVNLLSERSQIRRFGWY